MNLADSYRMLFGLGGKPSDFDKCKQLYEELLEYTNGILIPRQRVFYNRFILTFYQ